MAILSNSVDEGSRYRSEKITRKGRPSTSDLATLWAKAEQRLLPRTQRVRACRDVRYGRKVFSLPPEFDVPGAENLVVSLPQKITVPLKTINVLSRKSPRLQRFPVGETISASLTAANIETWVNAAIEKKLEWGELIGKLFDDGECAVITVPSLAGWQHAPDFMDSLDESEFSALDEDTQERYARIDENEDLLDELVDDDVPTTKKRYVRVNAKGKPQPDARYLRDSTGDPADHPKYDSSKRKFKENRKQSLKAYQEEHAHWLKEELPFEIVVLSPTECMPIFGSNGKLKGLIVRRTFNRETLLEENYVWDDQEDLLSETGDERGEVILYEYWGTDKDGTPFVMYSVNGADTCFRRYPDQDDDDNLDEAVVDLRKEFGLRKLPVQYCWGLHFETDDYKMKGVPFLWPVLGALTGVEALATSILVHAYSTAFGAWGIAADPQIVNEHPEVMMDGDRPRNFGFAPLTTTILPGKPFPLVHPGVGKDVNSLMQMLMQASSSMAPSDTAFGGGNASSGHDRALSREYLETSMNQVLDGARRAYEKIGEVILELCCGISKMTGVLVPVYATVPVGQISLEGTTKTAKQKAILELKPEWVGPIFNLSAFYPQSAGENLAELQQLAQLYLQGLVTFREFREKGFGDENPAATLIEIFADQYLKSDAGRAEVAQIAAELMGADSDQEKQKLMDEKRLTAGGTPLAALPPELQAFHTGEIPPGMDPKLFLAKLQTMMMHNEAKQMLSPQGPAGASGAGPAGPPPGTAPATPAGGATIPGGPVIPPAMGPGGAPGPAQAQNPGQGNQAPTLSGMSVPNVGASQLGGEVAGAMGTASVMRDSAATAHMGH